MVTKTKGTPVAELAGERSRAARAEQAARRRIVAAAIAAAVVATGATLVFTVTPASLDKPPEAERAVPSTSPPAPTSVEPALTARGTIPKRLGELAGFGSAKDPAQNTFAIRDIVVDPPCDLGRSRPTSWHTIVLHVTAHTGTDARRAGMLGRILTPGFFEAIGPDGHRYEAWPGECTDPLDALPDDFGPNGAYSGTIELRLPVRRGMLILSGVMDNAAGWEWRF